MNNTPTKSVRSKFGVRLSLYPTPHSQTSWTSLTLTILLAVVAISNEVANESTKVENLQQGIERKYVKIYECPDATDNKDIDYLLELLTSESVQRDPAGVQDYLMKFERDLEMNANQDQEDVVENSEEPEDLYSITSEHPPVPPIVDPDFGFEWSWNEKLLVQGFKPSKEIKGFRLVHQPFNCSPPRNSTEFHWYPGWAKKSNLNTSLNTNPIKLSNMSVIEEGILVWNKEEDERHVYRREDYCISRRYPEGWLSFKVCTSTCSDTTPCVRKCCPPSEIINEERKDCISASPHWRPIFYKTASEQEKDTDKKAPNISIVYGFPDCPKKYMINESPKNNFKLLLNGTLVQIDGAKLTYINSSEFCIDGLRLKSKGNEDESQSQEGVVYSRSEWDQVVIACKPVHNNMVEWRAPVYASLSSFSSLCLLLTDIVYLLLWKHQNIHGWLQFAYTTSLFCTFNCFVVVRLWSYELFNISPSLCKIMGWITHLTYLSAFFWLTSMNFDLWWRFSRPLRSTRMRPNQTKWRRFLGFAVFSIGIPLLISGIGITFDYIYEDHLFPPFTVPGVGKERCYFATRSQLPYLYCPGGILLLIDLIFFTSTVLNLRKIHAHTELARTQSTMEDKKGLRVIAKLFIVMGVLWVFELASWIAHSLLPEMEDLINTIFIPMDILNSLQGVAIFIIFVCKPNVGSQLLAIFRGDDAGKSWIKQSQLPSVTIHQSASGKQNDYDTETK